MSLITIVAHRGASGSAPENTFAAFRKALEEGADAIEIDVHQSSDGKVVVIHDNILDRTTSGTGPVAGKTAQELQQLDAGSWFDTAFSAERIPLLSDLLDYLSGRAAVIVEVKFGSRIYPGIEQNIWSLLQAHSMVDSAVVSSTQVTVLNTFKHLSPKIRLGKVITPKELWRSLFQPHSYMDKQNLLTHIKELHPHWSFIDNHFMEWARSSGKTVLPWTVNKERKMMTMVDRGVAGIITNYPETAVKVVKKHAGRTA